MFRFLGRAAMSTLRRTTNFRPFIFFLVLSRHWRFPFTKKHEHRTLLLKKPTKYWNFNLNSIGTLVQVVTQTHFFSPPSIAISIVTRSLCITPSRTMNRDCLFMNVTGFFAPFARAQRHSAHRKIAAKCILRWKNYMELHKCDAKAISRQFFFSLLFPLIFFLSFVLLLLFWSFYHTFSPVRFVIRAQCA